MIPEPQDAPVVPMRPAGFRVGPGRRIPGRDLAARAQRRLDERPPTQATPKRLSRVRLHCDTRRHDPITEGR